MLQDSAVESSVDHEPFRRPAKVALIVFGIVAFMFTCVSFGAVALGLFFSDDPSIKTPGDLVLSLVKIVGPFVLLGPVSFAVSMVCYRLTRYQVSFIVSLVALVLGVTLILGSRFR